MSFASQQSEIPLGAVIQPRLHGPRHERNRRTNVLQPLQQDERKHRRNRRPKLETVSAREVDAYLRRLEEPKRSTLQALRRTILDIVPEAEEVISYRVPAFRVKGRIVAGFAAFKGHLSYLPFSGSVLDHLGDELRDYSMTKSALHFPVDRPLPRSLVQKLIA